MAEVTAMQNAKMWLDSAEATMKSKIYAAAIYSMEMAVEIALKALLIEFGINVPKLHNVTDTLRLALDENRRLLPEEFREREEFVIGTYNDLLELRPIVGYMFETNMSVNSEEKAKKYMRMAKEVVRLCGFAIDHMRARPSSK